ncbi:histidine phosphatase family protein [Actinoplanes bogorensis]|uniref:Histidine phosphatase family protein n=1 Tax=Paractinoplanes bogorensis TaxID=1610840 RepID=A0ABS5YNP2_9ACTN|nr:histidine phosphatase family protein [Actinoplanes bogorensis]MBU2665062.1 histidine phosphatase family protein [Actinoplanes bogorensis]
MSIEIVFETHALTEDNEAGIATGWLPGRLSLRGRENAVAMGHRRRSAGIAAVFCSDLRRSVETAELAFAHSGIPVLLDWRLRECDFGTLNGAPGDRVKAVRTEHIDRPFPGGESHRQAVRRTTGLLSDLPSRWDGQRVMLIGHLATYRALEHVTTGRSLEDIVADDFAWRPEGWSYRLGQDAQGPTPPTRSMR